MSRDRRRERGATVWLTGRRDATHADGPSDRPRDHTETAAIAAHAIAVHSQPGTTVCDPNCGNGSVVVEAVRLRRHAVGIAADPDAWRAARAALNAAKAHGAPGDGTVLDRQPDRWTWTGLGPVDLILTVIGPVADGDGVDGPRADRLSTRIGGYRDLAGPRTLLVVIATYQLDGGLDLASRIVAAGRAAGWRPVQRVVALTAAFHTPPSDTWPPAPDRAWPAHRDVIIFGDDAQAGHPRPPRPFPSRPAPAADSPVGPAIRVAV